MKSLVSRILTVGIALAAGVAVQAQDRTVTATVPFNFYVGSSLMPQGDYRVDELSHGAVLWIKSMQSGANKATSAASIVGKKETEPARLVFHRYGSTYFLTEIWAGNGPEGRTIARSSREKELAQDGAEPTLAVIRLALH